MTNRVGTDYFNISHFAPILLTKKSGEGFTLIESLLTIAIFVLALGAAVGLVLGLYRAQGYTFQQILAIEEARNGIETMIKEIREARGGDDGSYIIERADDFEFIFYSDIDKDGDTERIRYFIERTDFRKGVIDPSGDPLGYKGEEKITILSKYVRNQPPIFHYFDGNLQELPPPARLQDTKLMRVYLVINIDPDRPPQNFILENDVQLRNLKTNL